MKKSTEENADFLDFFEEWARLKRWTVPLFHRAICIWLERFGRIGVLRALRGGSKSNIIGCWIAYRLWRDRNYHTLVQGADDKLARKVSRHAKDVIRRHPWLKDENLINPADWALERWSVMGNEDPRDPSCAAHGILSNVTSSRAHEIINDDVEVPKNIKTPEAREKLRERLDEQTHILIPGGRKLFVGTPHTHDSLYEQLEAEGADVLNFKLFSHHVRYEDEATLKQRRFPFNFEPADNDDLYVFRGMKLLEAGVDYQVKGQAVLFGAQPGGIVDIYAGNIWPERFTRQELAFRRAECRTINSWDSQYQLHAKPLHKVRLDPDRMVAYEADIKISVANREVRMMLGEVRMVGGVLYWDPALGKKGTHASVASVVLTDERGRMYWEQAVGLQGDAYDEANHENSQCHQVAKLAIQYQLENVHLETNGPGTFLPPLLRRALAGTGIGVIEVNRKSDKSTYILDALEAPLSGRFLWAHARLWDTDLPEQMRDWIPGVENQADDYIDSGAGAIKQTPIRIGKVVGNVKTIQRQRWRPGSGVHEVVVEMR
jgi:hypothetical protein